MVRRKLYESPFVECLVIRFEANIMSQAVEDQGGSFSESTVVVVDDSGSSDWGW